MNKKTHLFFMLTILILLIQACNMPGFGQPAETPISPTDEPPTSAPPVDVKTVTHTLFPASAPNSRLFFDTESSGTAPEKRAPYGDSYDINRLERPFLQDMTYVPDLDVEAFSISSDENWYYVSIRLIGDDPNNSLGIHFGIELDTDRDGFGDFLILAEPTYSEEWTTANVKVYTDANHDSAGISAVKSDAPFTSDGYDSLIFDGGRGEGDDPDMAWVRIHAGPNATVQFAFKKSLTGNIFMFGVLADAGLKDVSQLDYVDRFTEAEAGSPIRGRNTYPLQALYAVDNTCWEVVGFKKTGIEPKVCPPEIPPTREPGDPRPTDTPVPTCPNTCPYGQDPYPGCACWPG